jgi:hypothetical protein
VMNNKPRKICKCLLFFSFVDTDRSASVDMKTQAFPEQFKWGAATAAYQTP